MEGLHIKLPLVCLWGLVCCAAARGQHQTVTAAGVHPVVAASPSLFTAPDTYFQAGAAKLDRLLAESLAEELNVRVVSPHEIAEFLQAHPPADPFEPDQVRKVCTAFALQHLLLPVVEVTPGPDAARQTWRLMLRWLAGSTGEMTKYSVSEWVAQRDSAEALPADFVARVIVQNLLRAPDLAMPSVAAPEVLPALQALPPAPVDSLARPRRWVWYLTAAAVLSGGSAYLLLVNPKDEAKPAGPLPEPPGPPH